ncbi:fam-h protein [Plasmodium relictum]|uniref:Fam-h protein n=1 Tax=Plasmodium relictum TaxID=85471 RepID=A0A1J1GK69_PLARL|nr:fam-h protein [Plasmodium relictum]CRG84727.1 fam-h protein [Plasmodium relictum]
MSTIKIYNKEEKKKVFNYLMRFFMFTFLLVSFRSWNYENELKNVLNLGIKRSLAENKNMEMQAEEESNFCENVVVTKGTLESWNEQNDIRGSMDAKEGNEIQIKEKNQKVKFNERILGICKTNFKLITLSVVFISSIFFFIISVLYTTSRIYIYLPISELCSLYILIISILLTYKEIKIKHKNKSK